MVEAGRETREKRRMRIIPGWGLALFVFALLVLAIYACMPAAGAQPEPIKPALERASFASLKLSYELALAIQEADRCGCASISD